MLETLAHKIALVTGATSGIGLATAELLAEQHCHLILLGRRTERLNALQERLQASYPIKVLTIVADVRKQTALESMLQGLSPEWKDIDILINNAGLAKGSDPLYAAKTENWDTMIDTNIKGLLYVTHAILPSMVQRQSGHIVNVGSIAGQEYYPNGNVYSATKHAVRAISKSLRLDLHGKGIRVTEIDPGAVATEFSQVRWEDKPRADAFYNSFKPLESVDVARSILFALMQPSYVNISEITIMPTVQASCNHLLRVE